MATEPTPIPFEEFAANVASVFDRVVRNNSSVVVEAADGAAAVLAPLRSSTARTGKSKRRPSRAQVERARAGILEAAGAWKDIDAEALKAYIYERRRNSPRRPPVRL